MAKIYPDWENINRLRVKPEEGERYLLEYLESHLDDDFEIFFNPYLDGDRPDVIILKKGHGAVVIEVKDWELSNYCIDSKNLWYVLNNRIRSPQQQAFRYKSNLFELHIPILGLSELSNKNFYKVINVYVYFHKILKIQLASFYGSPEQEIRNILSETNALRGDYNFEDYEKKINYWESKKKQLSRDLSISICRDSLDLKVNKIKNIAKNSLFTDEIYQDLRRRLMPSSQVLEQGIKVPFDSRQLKLSESSAGLSKIKGVAGCGKTSILAQRAINARKRHGDIVLILTFNITIRFYIKDVISRIAGSRLENEIEVIHYHGFINEKINQYGISIEDVMAKFRDDEPDKLEKVYSYQKLFEGRSITKYKSIFIDEIQDYDPDWIKIIRDNFLEDDGEMVMFGDQSQNIYDREESKRASPIVLGFGSWNKLTKSYRSSIDAPLVSLFSAFQKEFLLSKYNDAEIFESFPTQSGLLFDVLNYEFLQGGFSFLTVLGRISDYIRRYNFHPNDIAIIASQVEPLFLINTELSKSESTKIMFETEEELKEIFRKKLNKKAEIERIRRRKKSFFYQNSGLIKLSTIHSFKGLESETVFFILMPDDNPEVIYTAITRAKKNLIVFNFGESKFHEFFAKHMTPI
ncbi:UvrD-like helicase C-terminal domain-containing protein [Arsukibacterium tuosuense]|uniref:DNA 3'-5' helicase II n=1 Tax=Arsukibacterium tuosuense TaxID=1323745 RepID=A0A285JF73_9GAMM|nr:NERD domain-containing protein [Arsukibacterium tuosuense]SNY58477.1 UvrD-like helicase C-terminal domain-containing protein [Arsukibacterium tuosuense]